MSRISTLHSERSALDPNRIELKTLSTALEAAETAYTLAFQRLTEAKRLRGVLGQEMYDTTTPIERAEMLRAEADFNEQTAKEHENDTTPATETGLGTGFPAWNKSKAEYYRSLAATRRKAASLEDEKGRPLQERRTGADVESEQALTEHNSAWQNLEKARADFNEYWRRKDASDVSRYHQV
jgi:hypothetical protein